MPSIEVPYHADAPGIGSPGGEAHPTNALVLTAMGAHHAIKVFVPALCKQVQIQVAEHRRKAVGVLRLLPVALIAAPAQLVIGRRCAGNTAGKEIGVRHALHGQVLPVDHHSALRRCPVTAPASPLAAHPVAAEHLKGIVVLPRQQAAHTLIHAFVAADSFHCVSTDLYQP